MPFDNITKTAIFTYCTRDLPNDDWYDGTIKKCTVALDDGKNIIGKIGNHGLLHFDVLNYSWWVNYDPYEECKSCSIYPICIGKKCPNGYLSHHGCETIKGAYTIGMKKYIKAYLKQKRDKLENDNEF